jgi:anti-repressor protein
MNELQIFSYEGNDVRTIGLDGETWWVLKDVCDVLELSNSRIVADRLDEDDVSQTYIADSLGRNQETTVVNESGLYAVILRSDKPQAKPFQRWVTHEVLPSIRKTGMYATREAAEKILGDPDFLIAALTEIKEIREKNAVLSEAVAAKRQQIAELQPKVLFADAVSASRETILIGELAKILRGNGVEIGQNRMFEILRNEGFLIKRKGTDYNMPTQRAMELGLFRIKETAITHSDGHVTISKTVKVTGKGQQYFINMFLKLRRPVGVTEC